MSKPKDPAFFLNATGTRLVYSTVKANFQTLLRHAGLHDHPGRGNPRIHDLRHYADGRVMRPAGVFRLVRVLVWVLLSA